MNGDRILNRISSDSEAKAKNIIANAEKQRADILSKAESDAKKAASQINAETEKKLKHMMDLSKSRTELEIRNAVLKQRRIEIDRTVTELKDYVLSLPVDEYFNLIYRQAAKISGMEGVVLLNSKDKSRLPNDFTEKLKAAGVTAAVADENAEIDGGFILKHGDIEENMSVSSVIADKRDELEDYINRKLFND